MGTDRQNLYDSCPRGPSKGLLPDVSNVAQEWGARGLLWLTLWLFAAPLLAESLDLPYYLKEASRQKLSESHSWQRFFHARVTGRSLALNRAFFVSAEGLKDYRQDLAAHLTTLLGSLDQAQALACRFPARTRWLEERLQLPRRLTGVGACRPLDKFRAMVKPKAVWVVFASYFLDSPASSYGHTMLRLSRNEPVSPEPFNDLLDYSVGFAASIDTENPLLYTYRGLTGGFHGIFTALPYYYKIREYSDIESRDLWSYQLDLKDAEVDRLVDLIWELDQAYFQYYYLTKNCSYFLLSLLEAVSDDFSFIEKLPFYIIPLDTVKALYTRPGFVKSVAYRPSARSKFFRQYRLLSEEAKGIYRELRLEADSSALLQLSKPLQREVLDVAISQFDYFHPRAMIEAEGPMYEKKRAYLSMRSKILEPSPSFLPEANSAPPHKGHPSKKMGLSAGMINAPTSKSVSFEEFRLRFSFHDLEDLQEGHFFSNLTMFDFHARAYREDGSVPKLRLARATLFDIFSLRPVNHFEQPWSWKAEVSWRDLLEPDCFQCYAAHLGGAGGFSLDLDRSGSSLVVYALLSLSGDLLSRREKGKGGLEMRLVGGPQAGLWMHVLSPDDYLHLEASRLFERQTGARMRVVLKYGLALDRTWQLHLKYDQIARQREGSVGLSRYL